MLLIDAGCIRNRTGKGLEYRRTLALPMLEASIRYPNGGLRVAGHRRATEGLFSSKRLVRGEAVGLLSE
jgi:hypothetical protein